MTEQDGPPPHAGSASQAGCVAACGFAFLPILYVGSFGLFYLDAWFEWGYAASLDKGTRDDLHIFFWPLIWLYNHAWKIAG